MASFVNICPITQPQLSINWFDRQHCIQLTIKQGIFFWCLIFKLFSYYILSMSKVAIHIALCNHIHDNFHSFFVFFKTRTDVWRCHPQLYLMKYGYMEVPTPETRSAQLLAPNGLLDYILEFQVSPHLIIGRLMWWIDASSRLFLDISMPCFRHSPASHGRVSWMLGP